MKEANVTHVIVREFEPAEGGPSFWVEICIDMNWLCKQMADKVRDNKTRKARAMNDAIDATLLPHIVDFGVEPRDIPRSDND